MKKIYVQSRENLISHLFLFDLDNNFFYYLTKDKFLLKHNMEELFSKYDDNKFVVESLKKSYKINDSLFEKLLNKICNEYYSINVKDFFISIGLEEYII